MIDLNAYIGRWPFGPVKPDTPAGLLRLMDRAGIERAAVTPFEALFYKDALDANKMLSRAVRGRHDRLVAFGALNPAYPDWETDLGRSLEGLELAGLRLFPSYHGYTLEDACCREFLAACAERNVPVQVVPAVSDPRMHHPRAAVPAASMAAVPGILNALPALRLCVLNANLAPIAQDLAALRASKDFFCDIAWTDGLACLDAVAGNYGLDSVVFGSSMPLLPPLSAQYKLKEVDWDAAQIHAVTIGNARRFLGEIA
jgi:hypothetical protein